MQPHKRGDTGVNSGTNTKTSTRKASVYSEGEDEDTFPGKKGEGKLKTQKRVLKKSGGDRLAKEKPTARTVGHGKEACKGMRQMKGGKRQFQELLRGRRGQK